MTDNPLYRLLTASENNTPGRSGMNFITNSDNLGRVSHRSPHADGDVVTAQDTYLSKKIAQEKVKKLAAQGRGGDTELALIGKKTAKAMDKAVHGGKKCVNPKTGLREYCMLTEECTRTDAHDKSECNSMRDTKKFIDFNDMAKKIIHNLSEEENQGQYNRTLNRVEVLNNQSNPYTERMDVEIDRHQRAHDTGPREYKKILVDRMQDGNMRKLNNENKNDINKYFTPYLKAEEEKLKAEEEKQLRMEEKHINKINNWLSSEHQARKNPSLIEKNENPSQRQFEQNPNKRNIMLQQIQKENPARKNFEKNPIFEIMSNMEKNNIDNRIKNKSDFKDALSNESRNFIKERVNQSIHNQGIPQNLIKKIKHFNPNQEDDYPYFE